MTAIPADNPLLSPVLRVLRQHPLGLSEFALIRALELDPGFPPLAADAQLALFQKHFLVMNALYRLRDRLWREEGLVLEISPLAIVLRGAGAADGRELAQANHALRDYYLDWRQLRDTDSTDVAQLLEGFWRRFRGAGARVAALATLGLEEDADWPAVRRRYRELAGRHHPDRGGDTARFLAVREAYETLSAGG